MHRHGPFCYVQNTKPAPTPYRMKYYVSSSDVILWFLDYTRMLFSQDMSCQRTLRSISPRLVQLSNLASSLRGETVPRLYKALSRRIGEVEKIGDPAAVLLTLARG
jgi:hypothetical protein